MVCLVSGAFGPGHKVGEWRAGRLQFARPRHSLLGHDLAELRQVYQALGASVAGFEVAELLSSVEHLSNDDLANAHNCRSGHPRAVSMRLVSVLPTCLRVLGLPRLLRFISRDTRAAGRRSRATPARRQHYMPSTRSPRYSTWAWPRFSSASRNGMTAKFMLKPPVALGCPGCGGARRRNELGKLLRYRCHIGDVIWPTGCRRRSLLLGNAVLNRHCVRWVKAPRCVKNSGARLLILWTASAGANIGCSQG